MRTIRGVYDAARFEDTRSSTVPVTVIDGGDGTVIINVNGHAAALDLKQAQFIAHSICQITGNTN